jgi:predicted metal-dependent HD superfamily phosphohydrolase
MSTPDISSYWSALHPATGPDLVNNTYASLLKAYQSPDRHYHNWSHIQQLVALHETYARQIADPDTVLFSIFFHDIVYDTRKSDNEEKSAEAAVAHGHEIGLPVSKTEKIRDFIIATKTHINTHQDPDLDYFLDFDLQILGTDPATYQAYTRQIRQEYHIYPDLLYKPGRKKVLQHFLEMRAIYVTPAFRELYETNARQNIQAELNTL